MKTRFSGSARYVTPVISHALRSNRIWLIRTFADTCNPSQHSMLYLPQDHPLMDEKGMDKRLKTKVVTYRELTSRHVL